MLRVQLSKLTSPRKLLMIFQMFCLSYPSSNLNNKQNKNLKCLVRVKYWPMLSMDRKSRRLLFFLHQLLKYLQLFQFLQFQTHLLLLLIKLLLKLQMLQLIRLILCPISILQLNNWKHKLKHLYNKLMPLSVNRFHNLINQLLFKQQQKLFPQLKLHRLV